MPRKGTIALLVTVSVWGSTYTIAGAAILNLAASCSRAMVPRHSGHW
ncbi:MAG: hypothetical protein ACP5G7_08095 [Anaerolineae bacterium]